MKLTLREAAERFGVTYNTLQYAAKTGRLPFTLDAGADSVGRKMRLMMVRPEDVEAYLAVDAVDESDRMTLVEAAETVGLDVTALKNAIQRGVLAGERANRRVTDSLGRVQVRSMWVVTDEALDAYMAWRNKPRRERMSEAQKRSVTSVNNPYPEHWASRTVPDHIRPAFYLLCKVLEAGIEMPQGRASQQDLVAAADRVTVTDNTDDLLARQIANEEAGLWVAM